MHAPFLYAALSIGNERNFVCFKCKRVVEGALKGFQLYLKRKDHIPPYICGQDGCLNDYLLRPSLYDHIRKHHMTVAQQVVAVVAVNTADHEDYFQHHATPPQAVALAADAVVADAVVPFVPQDELVPFQLEVPEEHDEVAVDLLQSAEKSVLRLRSVTYMTSTAVEAVQKECFLLMEDTALHLKNKVLEYLLRTDCDAGNLHQLLSEFSLSDPFVKIRTKAQQMSCFQKKYGLLMPEEIFLGYTMDSRLNTLRLVLEPTQVAASFQYLSIKDILKSVMSDPYLRNLIINGNVRSEDGYVRSFCDGELYATLPDELKMCVRVVLYIDDLEIVQALSARIGVYKVGGIYFGIQNLPAELNALLSNIFVTALAYAGDVKRPEVWAPFLKDMKELENEGCEMIVDGEPFFFRALLIAQIGDSLAAHEVLGFSHSSSNVFCRCCYINRSDMWKDGTTLGAPRTMERHALDLLGTQNAVIRKATGVKGPPLIDGLRFFQPIRNSVFDIFHDLQQGVCKMEVKLALREYVCIKKYFTEQQMNSRIKFFDYGLPDKKNKPSATITAKYLADIESYNLHQTGAQMWCLTRAFGFLFGDLVPKDDKFMVLISLLNQIMMIVFSHAHCEFDLNNLEHLVPAHHSLFLEIFPGRPEPELQVEQEAEPSGVDDNEDCDDPEEINVDTESEVFVRPEECFEEYEGLLL
ncbi:uncharacterized protein LOC117647857 [Thrips palmi]|uniref:Uncharacterized protein LOC117647857 n=1 Tax=Thrips palmi TaxID=161013 RepID=A0A6P8Z6A7_THRPL|nr:uncharacterized protein LOC117647857 [Thrips palmi]